MSVRTTLSSIRSGNGPGGAHKKSIRGTMRRPPGATCSHAAHAFFLGSVFITMTYECYTHTLRIAILYSLIVKSL